MVSGVVGIVKVFFHFVSKKIYRACSNDFFIRPNLKKKTPYNTGNACIIYFTI